MRDEHAARVARGLKILRERQGLTLEEVGLRVDLPAMTLYTMELGQSLLPARLADVARFYGVEPSEIEEIGREGE